MKRLALLGLLVSVMSLSSVHADEQVVSGGWQTIGFEVAGQWQIVNQSDGLYVVLDDDFETKDGPDLYVLLSPKPADQLTDSNTAEGALVVGLLETQDDSTFLRKMKGAQQLKIPDGVNLGDYKSIAIHCIKYSHVWAAADLP